MVIRNVKEALASATGPIAKALHHNAGFKVLVIGFRAQMELREHTAKWPSKLTVLEGSVTYKEGLDETILKQYDEIQIPILVPHSVFANEDSLCLLTQSDEATG